MAAYSFEGKAPRIGSGTYIHPQATLIGEVEVGSGCYVGAGARLRGDWGRIVVADGCNIQENCILHVDVGAETVLGSACHLGHGAILHGARLAERVYVGMGAVIMDGVTLGAGCCVGAGAVVTAHTEVPAGKLVLGTPAHIAGDVNEELARRLARGTRLYQELAGRCLRTLEPVTPDDP